MPHSYHFADAEHTIVGRDDGKSFAWPRHIDNVANLNGRIAEEYRLEGSPKISPYTESKPVAATKPKQQTKPLATVESAEAVLAALEEDRRQLVSARAADDAEMSKHAYQAHALHELGASRSLDEISKRAIERDQRLRELDCAIFEARERLVAAQAFEARAVDQARAEEASKIVGEMADVFSYVDKHMTAAAKGLLAIDMGFKQLRGLGVAHPDDTKVRLAVVTCINTWAMQLPRNWHSELRDGLRFLEPAARKSFTSYWNAILPSLRNTIAQAVDAPVPKAPAMQRPDASDRREAVAAAREFLSGGA